MDGVIDWPIKSREFMNHHMDSTRWNDFRFRDDDIVIASWAKSGTTWMQQILGQLIFDGAEGIPVMAISPWLDLRVLPFDEIMQELESQQHRRFLKTHLPLDALVFSPDAKYLYVARDGRDTVWSLYNHHSSYTETFYDMVNNTPGRVGHGLQPLECSVVEFFNDWLDRDGYPYWEFFAHTKGWWDVRHLPNVMLVHFNELKRDMPGEMRRIAEFLEIELDEAKWPEIVEHCSFDYMKRHAEELSPMLEVAFRGGGSSFVHKGTNGRWNDLLSTEDIDRYERIAVEKLGPECAHWLATGELPA